MAWLTSEQTERALALLFPPECCRVDWNNERELCRRSTGAHQELLRTAETARENTLDRLHRNFDTGLQTDSGHAMGV
ncbi:hypothetical protein COCON_G00128880 [Conger conger]|uniref:Uncharacterized protein n=1 Tax=Conger conger TaxID=82655 RepID=A0A9Q1HWY5_CONCO|nr:hypothetical protein COCON_G00128880 [Conger conger]